MLCHIHTCMRLCTYSKRNLNSDTITTSLIMKYNQLNVGFVVTENKI